MRFKSDAIVGADFIRSIACLWVFVRHLSRHTTKWEEDSIGAAVMRSGDYGVGMFFVLSGFLLSIPFWRNFIAKKPSPSLKVYAARRLGRIVPAYFLCILIMVPALGLYQSRWDLIALGSMLTFTNSFIAAMYKPEWNDPLWSIPIEIHFYLYLPIVTWLIFRFRSLVAACLVVLFSIFSCLLFQYGFLRIAPAIELAIGDTALFSTETWSTTKNSIALFTHFLIGMLASCVYVKKIAGKNVPSSWNLFDLLAFGVAAILLLTYVLEILHFPSISMLQYEWPGFPILIALLLLSLSASGRLGPTLENRLFKVTALLSYGIYLWHVPILFGADRLFLRSPLDSWFAILGFGALSLLATYLVAASSYYLVERRVLDLAKRVS